MRFEHLILQCFQALFLCIQFLDLRIDLCAHHLCAVFQARCFAIRRGFDSVFQLLYACLKLDSAVRHRLCAFGKLIRSGDCLCRAVFKCCGTGG